MSYAYNTRKKDAKKNPGQYIVKNGVKRLIVTAKKKRG